MFAELSETYLERLFDLCFRQVQRETGGWMAGRDRVGLFLSGGGARGRPYDEDFDLIALVDSDEPALRRFAERVVVLMNGQIARRGAIPQYRLGESLGRYVPSIDEVDALLSRDDDRLFVDRCQLLGSRLVVGNRDLAAQTVTRLLKPHLFDRAVPFVRRVAREIRERRGALRALPDEMLHLKDHPGGLREMDLALAAARARHLVWDTRGMDPFLELARRDTPRAEIYRRLAAINDYFVAVRSAYRVAVSATATIEREYLAAPARLLGCEGRAGASTGDALFEEVRQHLDEAARLVDRLLLDLAAAE